MKLGKRLAGVAGLVTPVDTLADIGCDHGFLSIHLVREEKCRHIIAADVNEGPILRAKEHIRDAGLEDHIETRISNGFEKINPGEMEAFIIAGMGGALGLSLLWNAREQVAAADYFIFQVQSELELARYCFREWGFHICEEFFIKERNAYYFIMRVVPNKDFPNASGIRDADQYLEQKRSEIHKLPYSEAGAFFYPRKITDPYGTYPEYLERETNRLNGILRKLKDSGQDHKESAWKEAEAERKMLEEIRNEM